MANLVSRASAALDKRVIRFMERRMAARAPAVDVRDSRTQLIELATQYNDPTRPFFATPPSPVVALSPVSDGPLGTHVVDLTFASDYEPYVPAARELYGRTTENHTVHARWWTSGRGRPTIVMLHGWGGGTPWITARQFDVPYWLRHGYDVAAYVLPHHGARAIGTSGALFPSPNPLRTNEAFGQAIHDVRQLALFLRSRGTSAVGALGMSLGGYITALWTSVAGPEDVGGLDFAIAMIPAVSFSRLMWTHGENTSQQKRAVSAGISEDLLADAFAVHAPLTRTPRLPPERLAVIAGRGDRITFPEQAEQLAAHWRVGIQWFDGGHLAQVGRGETFRAVRRQMGVLGFSGRELRL